MLNPAYQALMRIQSEISTTRIFDEIKVLMQKESSNPTVRISNDIWTLNLKALEQNVASSLELGFTPILTKGELEENLPHLIAIEERNALGLFALQEAFIKLVQEDF